MLIIREYILLEFFCKFTMSIIILCQLGLGQVVLATAPPCLFLNKLSQQIYI
jgi:hypothetical protein